MKPGALGEHPTGEDALLLAGELDLIHLDERGRIRWLRRRTRVAHPGRHFQRAEFDGLIHGDFQVGDAPRDLVERGKHGDLILDSFRVTGTGRQGEHAGQYNQGRGAEGQSSAESAVFLHHAAHLIAPS